MKKSKILLVDDDVLILESKGFILEAEGFVVKKVKSGKDAIKALEKSKFDLVETDLLMGDVGGIAVLKRAKELDQETMVIILTGYGDMNSAIDALRLNADDYLQKPCEPDEIIFRVKQCLEKQKLYRKVKLYEKILPVCSKCKKIRDDTGKVPGTGPWYDMEIFMEKRANIDVSHGICPDCVKKYELSMEKIKAS